MTTWADRFLPSMRQESKEIKAREKFNAMREKRIAENGQPVDILPRDVVKAIFLKWAVEFRLNPDGFKSDDDMKLLGAEETAEANTKCFLKYADSMGVNHP